MNDDAWYVEAEFRKLETADAYRIKVLSDVQGETRFLMVTPAQLEKIKEVLKND